MDAKNVPKPEKHRESRDINRDLVSHMNYPGHDVRGLPETEGL